MFTIYNTSAAEFNQWDLNQKVTEPGLAVGDKVVFFNSNGNTYPMKAYSHDGAVVVDVPNVLLTMCVPICVYINGCDETKTRFIVVAQDKPDDYVCVDNDDWPGDADEVTRDATIAELAANRQIGYEEPAVTEKVFECTIPADEPGFQVDGLFTLRTDRTYRVTVDGKPYDCFVTCGESSAFFHLPDWADLPVFINCSDYTENGNMVTVKYLDVSPSEQGVSHVTVEMVEKEATLHTIDEKYLPSGGGDSTLYITLPLDGSGTNPELDALYQALMDRKPVNPIFVCGVDFSTKWDLSTYNNKFAVDYSNRGEVFAQRGDNGTWRYENP